MPASVAVGNTVSVYDFRRRGDRVEFLTLLRSPALELGGSWQSVHGKVEPGETSGQAALRELREETGLGPAHFYTTNHVELFYDPSADEFQLVPAFAAEVDAASEVTVSREHVRAEWCSVDNAVERFLWPTQRQAVARIVRDIVAPVRENPWLLLGDAGRPR